MAKADQTRERILDAALALLVEEGRDAVSTRAVTSAVDIQAPTLYRLFGDKQGLLDAVAAHGFARHLASWDGPVPGVDPVEAIRAGWDMHIRWGLENPALYSIAYGEARPGVVSSASTAIDAILLTLVEQAALAGRLRVPVQEAVNLLRAVGTGVVFTLVAMPPDHRDPHLSARGREAVLATILTTAPATHSGDLPGAAMQVRMSLGDAASLTGNERALLGDWLERIASDPA